MLTLRYSSARFITSTKIITEMTQPINIPISNFCQLDVTTLDSLLDTWKIEKCRLQQSYNTTPDTFVKSIEPKVRSGTLWTAQATLSNARRDIECEAMRGMIQPHFRAVIGFGEWIKSWERMSVR